MLKVASYPGGQQSDWPLARCERSHLRSLQRWSAMRRKDHLEADGVDEIYFGQQMSSSPVVITLPDRSSLCGSGRNRKQETLDEFFRPN